MADIRKEYFRCNFLIVFGPKSNRNRNGHPGVRVAPESQRRCQKVLPFSVCLFLTVVVTKQWSIETALKSIIPQFLQLVVEVLQTSHVSHKSGYSYKPTWNMNNSFLSGFERHSVIIPSLGL